jgi:hypothetical protein
MKKHIAFLLATALCVPPAFAQTNPGLSRGAVLTPGQWDALFSSKQDVLGFTPMNVNGGVLLGRLITAAPGASTSGLNLTPGTTPGSPANGDLWVTSSSIFAQVNGSTVDLVNGVCPTCAALNAATIFTASPQTVQGLTTMQPGWYAQITGDTSARVRIGLNSSDIASIGFGPGNAVRDTFIERSGAAALRLGAPDAASPIAQTLGVQNVVAGTSNTAGSALTINGSRGTGNAAGGPIVFQYASAGSSGTSQNTPVEMFAVGSSIAGSTGVRYIPNGGYNSNNSILFNQGTGANGAGGGISFIVQNGPTTSPTAIINGQELGFIQSYGWDGSLYGPSGPPTAIVLKATENWTPSAHGQGVVFQATPNGTSASNNEISINNGLTALAAAEDVKPGLGLGTINAENGLYDNSHRVVYTGGPLGTPSSGVATNLTGTAAGLTAGNVTTNANLTGAITSSGNAASLGSFSSANLRGALTDETGTGTAVFGTSPNITTPTGIVANDVGLGNVNNTSDATKNTATATLTNKTLTAPILTKGIFTSLSACTSGTEGMMAAVTDSATAVWGATITGSSTNHVLAYCDGTNWTVAGK